MSGLDELTVHSNIGPSSFAHSFCRQPRFMERRAPDQQTVIESGLSLSLRLGFRIWGSGLRVDAPVVSDFCAFHPTFDPLLPPSIAPLTRFDLRP